METRSPYHAPMEEIYYAALEDMSSARNTLEDAIERVKNAHRQLIQERDDRIDELERKIRELENQFSGN